MNKNLEEVIEKETKTAAHDCSSKIIFREREKTMQVNKHPKHSKPQNEIEKDLTKWCIPVPKKLDDAVEYVAKHSVYVSKSEFVRDCVVRRLNELGYNQNLNISFTIK